MSTATITLSSKGQVVIPKEIRDEVAVVRQLIAGNSVFVSLNTALNNTEMHVYTLEGKETFRSKLQNQFTEIKLDTPKGIYLVEIIADEGRFAKKVYLD